MTQTAATYDRLDGMVAPCPDGLRHLITACADTKLLLGYHYGEWTFGTPELEAAVASCSLSQAELGHTRLLHAILKKHWNDDPDALIESREPAQFANIAFLDVPLAGWAEFVAMNAVVDMAVTRVLHSMRGCAFLPFRNNTAKMLDEERYHVHHGRGWFRMMASRDSCDQLGAATERSLASVACWFGPAGESEDEALVAGGFKDTSNPDLFAALEADVRGMADAAELRLSPIPAPDFSGWNPSTRRPAGTAPDDEILYHLRGTRNAIFKLN